MTDHVIVSMPANCRASATRDCLSYPATLHERAMRSVPNPRSEQGGLYQFPGSLPTYSVTCGCPFVRMRGVQRKYAGGSFLPWCNSCDHPIAVSFAKEVYEDHEGKGQSASPLLSASSSFRVRAFRVNSWTVFVDTMRYVHERHEASGSGNQLTFFRSVFTTRHESTRTEDVHPANAGALALDPQSQGSFGDVKR